MKHGIFLLLLFSGIQGFSQSRATGPAVTRENLLQEMTAVFEKTLMANFPDDDLYLLRFINCVWSAEQVMDSRRITCPLQRVDTARVESINRILFEPGVYGYFYYDHTRHTPEERGTFRCNPHPLCSEGRTDAIPNYIRDKSIGLSSSQIKDLYDIYETGGGFRLATCFNYIRSMPEVLQKKEVREYLAVMLWGYVCYYAGYDLIERARITTASR